MYWNCLDGKKIQKSLKTCKSVHTKWSELTKIYQNVGNCIKGLLVLVQIVAKWISASIDIFLNFSNKFYHLKSLSILLPLFSSHNFCTKQILDIYFHGLISWSSHKRFLLKIQICLAPSYKESQLQIYSNNEQIEIPFSCNLIMS